MLRSSRIQTARRRLCFRSWTVPLGLAALLGFSFAWFLPQQGFYWDDWPVVLTAQLRGLNAFWRFFEYNRPLSAWIYLVTFPVLGVNTLHWQIFALVLRWLTCVGLWWTLTLLWPRQRWMAAWTALLFAVYPVFSQQAISVAYTQHWTCYLLFVLSLGTMLYAQRLRQSGSARARRWFWPLSIISVLAFLLEILSMEYFSALELLRPLLLWIVAQNQRSPEGRRWEQAQTVLIGWLPYLAGTVGFFIWRFFFMKLARADVNSPRLLVQILSSPLESLTRLAEMAIQDLLFLFARAWADLIETPVDLSNRFLVVTWAAAAFAAAGVFIYITRLEEGRPGEAAAGHEAEARRTVTQGMLLGALAAVLGILPVWATNRQAVAGMYADRFGLAAMLGTSMFLASLIQWLLNDRRKQVLVLSLLVGLAVGYHIQTANDYRWVWTKQSRFYWQLKWRAPQLEPGTAVISEGEIFKYMGIYPTSSAINVLYLDHMPDEKMSYWFYTLTRDFAYNLPDVLRGMTTHSKLRNYTFTGNSHNGIVIYYNPDENDCLEVLSPGDETAPGLDSYTRQAIRISNPSRISGGPGNAGTPPAGVFGPEPEHGWCYLYEKASLARQQGDWAQVVALGEQARSQGFNPKASSSNTAFEWLPFIEGYAREGRWEEAKALSMAAFEKDSRIDANMCGLWSSFAPASGSGLSKQAAEAANSVRKTIHCPG